VADTNFINGETVIDASWSNAINDFFYDVFDGATSKAEAADALGAVDTIADTGTGEGLTNNIIGSTAQFKSLRAGAQVTIQDLGDELVINSSGTPTGAAADGVTFDQTNVYTTGSELQTTLEQMMDTDGLTVLRPSERGITLTAEAGVFGDVAVSRTLGDGTGGGRMITANDTGILELRSPADDGLYMRLVPAGITVPLAVNATDGNFSGGVEIEGKKVLAWGFGSTTGAAGFNVNFGTLTNISTGVADLTIPGMTAQTTAVAVANNTGINITTALFDTPLRIRISGTDDAGAAAATNFMIWVMET